MVVVEEEEEEEEIVALVSRALSISLKLLHEGRPATEEGCREKNLEKKREDAEQRPPCERQGARRRARQHQLKSQSQGEGRAIRQEVGS